MTAKMLGHYEREVSFYRTFPKWRGVSRQRRSITSVR